MEHLSMPAAEAAENEEARSRHPPAWMFTRAVTAAAALVRLAAAAVIGFAALTLGAFANDALFGGATTDTVSGPPVAGFVASAVEFDAAILEELSVRALSGGSKADAAGAEVWRRRPSISGSPSFRRAASPFSRADLGAAPGLLHEEHPFTAARRGIGSVLPILLGALGIVLAYAASLGVLTAEAERCPRATRRLACAYAVLIVGAPIVFALLPSVFHSPQGRIADPWIQMFFVGAFAAGFPRITARAATSRPRPLEFASSLRGRPARALAARLAAVEAAEGLASLVPAFTVATLFVVTKAKTGGKGLEMNGLGQLVVRCIEAETPPTALHSGVLLALALAYVTFLAHRVLLEVRRTLSPVLVRAPAPGEVLR